MRIVGVIPAAGEATRLQPLATSKEVLPVRGRPVLDYLVERMLAGGAGEVRVVTRPDKQDVIARAEELGALVVEGAPATVGESLALGLAGLEADDVVLLGFPDTIWEPVDGFRPLVDLVAGGSEVALGLFRTEELRRSDVVRFARDGTIAGIDVKPADPPSELIWGCAAARRRALDRLAELGEPGRLFDALARRGEVAGVELSDSWLDIGTREALARAGSNSELAAT